jgi:hypothetical protein
VREGILPVGGEQKLTVTFSAGKARTYDFKIGIQVTDTEGFYQSQIAKEGQAHPDAEMPAIEHTVPEMPVQEISCVGESFEVEFSVAFPNDKGLDFGSLKVGESKTEVFMAPKWALRNKFLKNLYKGIICIRIS